MAAVLHSRASTRKWSSTSNVNTVCGFLKLAGKSLARMRFRANWSDDLMQWHQRTDRLNIPLDDTTTSFDLDWKCVPESCAYVSAEWSADSSLNADILMFDGLFLRWVWGKVGHSSGWCGICIASCLWRRSDFWKKDPFHISTRWNGWFAWLETQHGLHQIIEPKQSQQRYVPGDWWHPTHVTIDAIDSCRRSSIRMVCRWLT